MKKTLIYKMTALLPLVGLISCVNELDVETRISQDKTTRDVALTTNTKYVEISQVLPINEKETPAFLGALAYQKPLHSTMYKVDGDINTPTNDYIDPNDLPVIIEGESNETIYDDGSYESSTTRIINTALSPIFQLYEIPINYYSSVTRVDINNGMMYAYNVSNELLFSQPHEGVDMTEYIAVLDEIIARFEADSLTRSIAPIERIKQQLKGKTENYSVTEGDKGCIIIESVSNDSATRTLINGSRIKTRITLSSDATRTLMTERFENDVLVSRVRYKYANNKRFKSFLNIKDAKRLNPHKTISETLFSDKNGQLKVKSKTMVYSKNTTNFFAKQ